MNTPHVQVQYITSPEGLRAAMMDVLTELNLIEKPTAVEVKRPATKSEACKYLGISIPTLDILLRTDQIKHFRIGRQVRINWADLENYVNQQVA